MTAPDPRVGEIEAIVANHSKSPGGIYGPGSDVAYLLAELRKAHEALARIEGFINERTEYVQVCRQTVECDSDYYRWQGHMEARRQLAQSMGYTVPYEPGDKTVRAAVAAANGGPS